MTNISEITGQEEDVISMQDAVQFRSPSSIGPDGKGYRIVRAQLGSGGRNSWSRLRIAGIGVPADRYFRNDPRGGGLKPRLRNMWTMLIALVLAVTAIGFAVKLLRGSAPEQQVQRRLKTVQQSEFAPAEFESAADLRIEDRLSRIVWLNRSATLARLECGRAGCACCCCKPAWNGRSEVC